MGINFICEGNVGILYTLTIRVEFMSFKQLSNPNSPLIKWIMVIALDGTYSKRNLRKGGSLSDVPEN
jgi:hypothetical protein